LKAGLLSLIPSWALYSRGLQRVLLTSYTNYLEQNIKVK
jgi:hypothetical protein